MPAVTRLREKPAGARLRETLVGTRPREVPASIRPCGVAVSSLLEDLLWRFEMSEIREGFLGRPWPRRSVRE